MIDKLLLERLSLAAIARVTSVSPRWLQMYVNQKFYQIPKTVDVSPKKRCDPAPTTGASVRHKLLRKPQKTWTWERALRQEVS